MQIGVPPQKPMELPFTTEEKTVGKVWSVWKMFRIHKSAKKRQISAEDLTMVCVTFQEAGSESAGGRREGEENKFIGY